MVEVLKVTSKHELASFFKSDRRSAGVTCERVAALDAQAEVIALDLSSLANVIEHCPQDQVISVETGITLAALDELLQRHHQWLPLLCADHDATILDIINLGDGGPLEHAFGGPRDLVLGLEVVLASGEIIKCGGKVVKNVTGYDLSKLFVGARGTLGIPVVAHLRLFARPEESSTILIAGDDAETLISHANRLIVSALPIACLEVFDRRLLAAGTDDEIVMPALRPSSLCLLVRVDGQGEVVMEVMRQIEEGQAGESCQLYEAQANAVLERLCKSDDLFEISASISQAQKLMNGYWSACGKPAWQYRPQAGRLRFLRHDADVSDWLKLLEELCAGPEARAMAPLAVSYHDRERGYQFSRVPAEDEPVSAMKIALKNKYDPSGRLNPRVSL